MAGPGGVRNGRSKITAQQAGEIRALVAAKFSLSVVGERYQLSKETVRDIGSKRLWAEAPEPDGAARDLLIRSMETPEKSSSSSHVQEIWDDLSGDPAGLTGKHCGRLTLRSYLHREKTHWWICDCVCGKTGKHVRLNALRSRHTSSCGCKSRELSALRCVNDVPAAVLKKHDDHWDLRIERRRIHLYGKSELEARIYAERVLDRKPSTGRRLRDDEPWPFVDIERP